MAASKEDYDNLVAAIAEVFDKISKEEWKRWQEGMAYNGFDPLLIAKKLAGIGGEDLVFLCAVAIMRGTRISKILERTADGPVKTRLLNLRQTYTIKDTGKITRETVTLSRITACFGFTTIATAERLGPTNMGIYYTVCPECPILGLSAVVLYARANSSVKILKGHIVIAALITKLVNPSVSDDEAIQQTVKYAKAVNGARLHDGKSYDFIDESLAGALETFYSGTDFKKKMDILGISKRDDIPSFALTPLDPKNVDA